VWWGSVDLRVKGSWRRENPDLRDTAGNSIAFEETYSVDLPRRLSALNGKLAEGQESRLPTVATTYTTTVAEGQPARLLIRGENMWRSTEVFVGAQRADRVRVLPNMGGVVAEFERVAPVHGAKALDISVVTSDGFAVVGEAKVVSQSSMLTKREVKGVGPRFIGDQTYVLEVNPPLANVRTLELLARSRVSASTTTSLATLGDGLELSRDGQTIRVVSKVTSVKLKAGDPIDLVLVVGSDSAITSENILVAVDARYYPQLADTVGKVEWASGGVGLRKIKITFPQAASFAYRDLSKSRVGIRAQLKTTSGAIVAIRNDVCVIAKGSCLVTLAPASSITDESTKDALKKGDFSLNVSLAGEDVPKLSPDSLAGK